MRKIVRLHSIQTPSESFVDIHAAGYNQHTKSEEADVSKYFVPPQVTVEEYKNAKGQHDVSSPSVDDVVHEIFKLTRLDVARVRDKRSTNIQNLTVHDDVGYSIDYEYVLYDDDDPFDNGTILNYNQLTDGHLNIDYFYDDISDENNTTVDDHLNIVNEHGDGTISGSVVGEMLPVPEPLRRSFVHRHRYAKRKFPWTNKKRPHHYYTPHHSVKPHKYEVVENHHHDTYRQPYHHQITKKPLSIHNYKDHLPSKKDADATNVIVINNSNDNHEHKSQLTHDHGHHYGGHVHGHGGPYHGRYKGHHHSGHHYRAPHKKPVQFVVRRRKPSKKTLKIINKIKAALRKVSHAG